MAGNPSGADAELFVLPWNDVWSVSPETKAFRESGERYVVEKLALNMTSTVKSFVPHTRPTVDLPPKYA